MKQKLIILLLVISSCGVKRISEQEYWALYQFNETLEQINQQKLTELRATIPLMDRYRDRSPEMPDSLFDDVTEVMRETSEVYSALHQCRITLLEKASIGNRTWRYLDWNHQVSTEELNQSLKGYGYSFQGDKKTIIIALIELSNLKFDFLRKQQNKMDLVLAQINDPSIELKDLTFFRKLSETDYGALFLPANRIAPQLYSLDGIIYEEQDQVSFSKEQYKKLVSDEAIMTIYGMDRKARASIKFKE